MKHLRQYIRQILLTEGMKTIEDMHGKKVKIWQRKDGLVTFKVIADGEWSYDEGYLHIRKGDYGRRNGVCAGAYEVRKSYANEGWGPFLYDVAIEWTGEDGLMCDRNSVSPAAMNVWKTYLESRPDIEAIDLDYGRHPFLTPEDKSDDCPQNTFMRWAHDELDAAGTPHDVYHFDPKKVPEHEKLYMDHWATKKYVRKDRKTPTLDALRSAGKLQEV